LYQTVEELEPSHWFTPQKYSDYFLLDTALYGAYRSHDTLQRLAEGDTRCHVVSSPFSN